MTDDIRALIDTNRAILTELREIRQVLCRQSQPKPITRAALQKLATFVPAIDAVKGDEPFTSDELKEIPALHGLTQNLSVKRIGWLLHRAEYRVIEGLTVERLGFEMKSILWRVTRFVAAQTVSEPPETASVIR